MIPWEMLDRQEVPGEGHEMALYRRGQDFSIRIDHRELMSSRVHGSEEALAELAMARLADPEQARVLIGGLGMGYTAAAALKFLGPLAQVIIAELVPAVVTWNQGPLAHLAGNPLGDPRVQVLVQDVAPILKVTTAGFDAILLDVDNGPQSMTRRGNAWLYSVAGLKAARATLRPQGVLAVWSATPDAGFSRALGYAGFQVTEVPVRARGKQGGSHHLIWLAVVPKQKRHP